MNIPSLSDLVPRFSNIFGSRTPSGSGQQTMSLSALPASGEPNPTSNSTSEEPAMPGEPTRKPTLSSIERDPNAIDTPPPPTPAPSTPDSQKPVVIWYNRLYIQLPLWKYHFHNFKFEILFAAVLALCAFLSCIFGYNYDLKIPLYAIGTVSGAACFTFAFFYTDEGPAFLSDKYGKRIPLAYLRPQSLDKDLCTLEDKAAAPAAAPSAIQNSVQELFEDGIGDIKEKKRAGIEESRLPAENSHCTSDAATAISSKQDLKQQEQADIERAMEESRLSEEKRHHDFLAAKASSSTQVQEEADTKKAIDDILGKKSSK